MNRPNEDLESQPVYQKTPLSLSLPSRILSILHSDVSVAYRETDESNTLTMQLKLVHVYEFLIC